jgi:hypothetical protein
MGAVLTFFLKNRRAFGTNASMRPQRFAAEVAHRTHEKKNRI